MKIARHMKAIDAAAIMHHASLDWLTFDDKYMYQISLLFVQFQHNFVTFCKF